MRKLIAAVALLLALIAVLAVVLWRRSSHHAVAAAAVDHDAPASAASHHDGALLAPSMPGDASVTPLDAAVAEHPAEPTPGERPSPIAARGLRLRTIDGFKLLHLGGGEPRVRPYGKPGRSPTDKVRGRVVDRRGDPVAGAVVLADASFHITSDTLMTRGGAITDADGSFEIDSAPAGGCSVVALFGTDWSNIVHATHLPVELVIAGHGALDVKLTYDGRPERFTVHVTSDDQLLAGRFETSDDGTLGIASLPPGEFSVTAELAQTFGGGQSASQTRKVTTTDGETTSLELAFAAGATVAVTASVPGGVTPKGLTYWLFRGTPPHDVAEARVRRSRENAPSNSVSASRIGAPMQFHDVSAGTYFACVALFDPVTFDAADGPFGCARVSVEGDGVVEISIAL